MPCRRQNTNYSSLAARFELYYSAQLAASMGLPLFPLPHNLRLDQLHDALS